MSRIIVTEFTVKRSEWLRGEGNLASRLLRLEDGKRCCVGFFGKALGIPDAQMAGNGSTYGIGGPWPPFLGDTGYRRTSLQRLFDINDSEAIEDETREARLINEFAIHGVKLTFVD